ncbi:MAG: MATE family efflux transporter [Lachnospiraceae bacterium]|jgi:putative MATE family efflux protein
MNHGLRIFSKYVSANVLGMIGISCYILADTFFIARGLGSNGLAALNLAIVMYSLIYAAGQMIGIGGGTQYAVAGARQDQIAMDMAFMQSIYMVTLVGILFVTAGLFFSGPISFFLGADEATFVMTNTYLRMIFLFSPVFMMNQVMIAFVRNDGNPALSMAAMLLGSGANIVLDYIFIFINNWGMFGAVLATCLAPAISLSLLSIHVIRRKNRFHLRRCLLRPKQMGNIAGLGMAAFINEISSGMLLFLFNLTILGLEGNIGVAAYGVVANLALVAVAMFTGVAQGVQPIISEAYGKSDRIQIRQMYRYAILVSVWIAVLLYVAVYAFHASIVEAFNSEHNARLQEMAMDGLKLYFVGFLFAGPNIITASCFGAMEKVRKSFVLSVLRGIVVIVPVLLLLARICGMTGVWLAFPCTELLVLFISICFVKDKKVR